MFSKPLIYTLKILSASIRYCLSTKLKCNQLAQCVINNNTALFALYLKKLSWQISNSEFYLAERKLLLRVNFVILLFEWSHTEMTKRWKINALKYTCCNHLLFRSLYEQEIVPLKLFQKRIFVLIHEKWKIICPNIQ